MHFTKNKMNIRTFINNKNELEEFIVYVKCLTYKRKKYILYTIYIYIRYICILYKCISREIGISLYRKNLKCLLNVVLRNLRKRKKEREKKKV